MEDILKSIETKITYVNSNTDNAFVSKQLSILKLHVEDFRNKSFKSQESVNSICDRIVNYEIARIKGVQGLKTKVYSCLDNISGLVESIKANYFNSEE